MAVIAPTITCTIRDTNPDTIALTGDNRVLVRYYSNAYVQMNVETYNGAYVIEDECSIRSGDGTYIQGTEGTFERVESNSFKCEATDSNGSYRAHTQTCRFVEYVRLTCNPATLNRPDGNGNMAIVCYGDYFNGDFGEKENELQCTYMIVDSNNDVIREGNMTVELTGNTYIARVGLTGLDYTETYSISFIASDLLHQVVTHQDGITGKPVFHWGKNDFVFEVPVTFKQGIADPDGKGLTMAEYGTWTPTFDELQATYSTQQGWYLKVGNVVTVGFNIYAKCEVLLGEAEGFIMISGLPYNPLYSANGGGTCSGALMYSTQIFQCFVAQTYGKIMVVSQETTGDDGSYLGTSFGYLRYPMGGYITLAGTITYMIHE